MVDDQEAYGSGLSEHIGLWLTTWLYPKKWKLICAVQKYSYTILIPSY